MAMTKERPIVVIGAGVIGLTTALKIQEKCGFRVTIIAETLPSDPKTARYTSHWAGAHHVSYAADDDTRQQKMDRETFDMMWELSAPGGAAETCFLRVPQAEFYQEEIYKPSLLEFMPDFRYLEEAECLVGTKSGVAFTTVDIDPRAYLTYLLSKFLAQGGDIVRGTVQHINQVIEGGSSIFSPSHITISATSRQPVAVVVCTGLGARTLAGVEDKSVYPIRGQTVLLRAPWVKFGRSAAGADGSWTYIIPRRSGDVIVGGTKDANDWYPSPRPHTTHDILTRGLALCPELVGPALDRAGTVEDLKHLVVEEGCGLRPARKGGIRLEVEWFERTSTDMNRKEKVPVVYNYGHGAYGYQSSWGSASMALELLEEALAHDGKK